MPVEELGEPAVLDLGPVRGSGDGIWIRDLQVMSLFELPSCSMPLPVILDAG